MSNHPRRSIHPVSLLCCIVFLFTVILSSHQVRAELVDRVVAVVNDDIITLSDVDAEGQEIFRKIIVATPPTELEDRLMSARADILDTLIDKQLIAQKASSLNVSVTDAEVDAAFDNVIRQNRITKDELLAKLAESGMSEKIYKSTLKSQLLQNKLIGTDIRSKIVITDEMVQALYNEAYTSEMASGSYYLLQIGFSWQDQSNNDAPQAAEHGDKTDAKNRAERVHALAVSGQDFSTLARKFSDLPSKEDGGDLGAFTLDEMAPYMRDAVRDLQPGQVSAIIETPVGYQFFKLLSAGDNGVVQTVPFESVKDKLKQQLFEEELKKAYSQWVKDLKNQAYIQKL